MLVHLLVGYTAPRAVLSSWVIGPAPSTGQIHSAGLVPVSAEVVAEWHSMECGLVLGVWPVSSIGRTTIETRHTLQETLTPWTQVATLIPGGAPDAAGGGLQVLDVLR